MPSSEIVDFPNLCVVDIKAKIESIPEFEEKTLYVYDQTDLLHRATALQLPFVGIIYEGMRSTGDSKIGLTTFLSCSILISEDGSGIGGTADESKNDATCLLELVRNCVRLTVSPTGHSWEFVEEALSPFDEDIFVYIQRWRTKAILTQGT